MLMKIKLDVINQKSEIIFFLFPLPFSPTRPSCLSFPTDWLSRLGLGNQEGSTIDHFSNYYLPSTLKD